MNQPSPNEVAEFLGAYERLSKFEATHRLIRGHGAFDAKELPIPACIKTIKWLYEVAGIEIPEWVRD